MSNIVVLLLVIFLVGCDFTGNVSATEYVDRAQTYIDGRNYDAAFIELKNALIQDPDNVHARYLLGKLSLDTGDGQSARKNLLRARELGMADDAVLPLLTQAILLTEQYQEVLDMTNKLSLSSNAASADVLAARGLAHLFMQDTDMAKMELNTALQKNPDSTFALIGNARLAISNNDLEGARRFIDRALKADASYAPAWGILGELDTRENKPEKAIDAYSEAIKKSVANSGFLQKRAMLFLQLQRYPEAQQDLDILKKRDPHHPVTNYIQGLCYFKQQRLKEASESFEASLSVDNSNMMTVFYLGVTQLLQGQTEQANFNLSKFTTKYPRSIAGRKVLALLKLQTREYKQAEELIRPVVNTNGNDIFSMNLLARALIKQGDSAEAVELLQRIVDLKPESAVARTRLATGQILQGDKIDAIENLTLASELDPNSQEADIVLILNYLRQNSLDKALLSAEEFVKKQPGNPTAQNMLGKVYLALGQDDRAKEAFESAREISPGDTIANFGLADLALKNHEPERARADYNQILEHHPGDLLTLQKLAAFEAGQGNITAMRAVLQRAISANPDSVQPRLLMAKSYLLENQPDQARQMLSNIPENQADNPLVLSLMGEIQLALGDNQAASLTLNQLIQAQPDSAEAHFLLAKAYAALNKPQELENELLKTIQLSPEHLYARIGLTRLQIHKGEMADAKANLKRLKASAPDNPDVLQLEAAMAEASKDTDKALAAYRKRFESSPGTQTLIDLVQLEWASGKTQDALQLLQQWIKQHPEDTQSRLALAAAYIKSDRRSDALNQYEAVLKVSANNLLALNNLAAYLSESNPERALKLAEKAYAIAPDNSTILDTLSLVYLNRGDLSRALRFNERSLENSPDMPLYLLRKASILEAAGNKDEAVTELKSLLRKRQSFPERAQAEQMLQRLSGS